MHRLKSMRPPVLGALVLMIIVAIGLHTGVGLLLLRTELGAFSLHSPLTAVMIGALVALAVLKLKHVLGFIRKKHHYRHEHSIHDV